MNTHTHTNTYTYIIHTLVHLFKIVIVNGNCSINKHILQIMLIQVVCTNTMVIKQYSILSYAMTLSSERTERTSRHIVKWQQQWKLM